MPIRKEEKHRYPKDWPAISKRIREKRAKNRCERCGVLDGTLGGRLPDGYFLPAFPLSATESNEAHPFWPGPGETAMCGNNMMQERLRIIEIVLTVAHLNHRPEDCRDDNLAALCQRCHLTYDAKHKAAGIKSRNRAKRASGDLFAEVPGSTGSPAPGPIIPLHMPPLFIPLKAEYFARFKANTKTLEWRPYGKRWNENTCRPGRRATLSLGYGKQDRLDRVVVSFGKVKRAAAPAEARKLFPRVPVFASIELREVPHG